MGAHGEKKIAAGPLFLFGAGLFLLGLLRRRLAPLIAGGAAMWLDRESLLSRLRGSESASDSWDVRPAAPEPAAAPSQPAPEPGTDVVDHAEDAGAPAGEPEGSAEDDSES